MEISFCTCHVMVVVGDVVFVHPPNAACGRRVKLFESTDGRDHETFANGVIKTILTLYINMQ